MGSLTANMYTIKPYVCTVATVGCHLYHYEGNTMLFEQKAVIEPRDSAILKSINLDL